MNDQDNETSWNPGYCLSVRLSVCLPFCASDHLSKLRYLNKTWYMCSLRA